MNDNLEKAINDLSKRLEHIERMVGIRTSPPPISPKVEHANPSPPVPPSQEKKFITNDDYLAKRERDYKSYDQTPSLSSFMGFLGVICILGAFILLIKFSIDSGWLTPLKQIIIATVLGLLFTISPQIIKLKDKSYLSLLPSLGVIVLHLCVYGGVFYHQIFDAMTGILSITMISLYSLYLLHEYKEEYFAIFAILGTYVGAMALHSAFSNLYYFAIYLLIWNTVFSMFSIKMNNRFYLLLSAYLSLFFVASITVQKSNIDYLQLSILQFLQIVIYSFFIARHSIVHKQKLSEAESFLLFPIYLFFYATEFHFLNQIDPSYATIFALVFSGFILALTAYAKNKLGNEKLDSSNAIYTFVSLMIYHSIFIMHFGPVAQNFVGIIIAIIMCTSILTDKKPSSEFKGVSIVSGIVLCYLIASAVFNFSPYSYAFNFTYGVIFLVASLSVIKSPSFDKREIFLFLAHSQIVLAIYRANLLESALGSSVLMVLYAFFVLGFAVHKKDKLVAKSSFPIIIFGFIYGIGAHIFTLNTLNSIIGLALMGSLIYICGYLYRKISNN